MWNFQAAPDRRCVHTDQLHRPCSTTNLFNSMEDDELTEAQKAAIKRNVRVCGAVACRLFDLPPAHSCVPRSSQTELMQRAHQAYERAEKLRKVLAAALLKTCGSAAAPLPIATTAIPFLCRSTASRRCARK